MSVLMLETIAKISLIACAGLLLSLLARRHSAARRHWILAMTVACAWFALPLSLAVPSWATVPWNRAARSTLADVAVTEEYVVPASDPSGTHGRVDRLTPAPARSRVSLATIDTPALPGDVWIAGALVSTLLLIVGLVRLQWLSAHAEVLQEGPWHDMAEGLRASFGISSPIRILQSETHTGLMTWGWRRPTLLIPVSSRAWSPARIEVVLTHELAHIARHDWLWQLMTAVLSAGFWFNPFMWVLSRRLRAEAERACDDAVLARGINGRDYATHLLAIARAARSARQFPLPAPAMARPSSLEGRITAMLNTTLDRHPLSRRARLLPIFVLTALTIIVAGLRAQSAFYTLTGTITDPTGRVLPNVTVALTNGSNGSKYEVHSDGAGHFEFVGLPTATYSLETRLPGFANLKLNELTVSGDVQRDLRLNVATLEETVNVRDGSVPTIEADPVTRQRREDARRRALERLNQARDRCAATGTPTPLGGNILPPLKLVDVRPHFPDGLRGTGIGGPVTMTTIIGTDGLVRDIENVKGPHPDLERAATDAVRQWQFSTTLLNCDPIDVNMKVTVNFTPTPPTPPTPPSPPR